MKKKITIQLISGATFACALEEEAIIKLIQLIREGEGFLNLNTLKNLNENLATEELLNMVLLNKQCVQCIIIENISNISVPGKDFNLFTPGGTPA